MRRPTSTARLPSPPREDPADVIYCVVPEELAGELYDKLESYYHDDPNVKVIIDRRQRERRDGGDNPGVENRQLRERRRARVPGEFPPIDIDD